MAPSDMFDDTASIGLLPAGLSDLLDPEASKDADATATILSCFHQFGYARVKPPLVEFEDSLLHDGPGAAVAQKSFRLMDPISHKMMALRADMTAQIARISGTRLSHAPRPLRLAYAGEVMRVAPDMLNPERQQVQAGAELIGRADNAASAEVIALGARALIQAGISGLTLDLGTPRLAQVLIDEAASQDVASSLLDAIAERDVSRLADIGGDVAPYLIALLEASGRQPDELAGLIPTLPKAAADLLSDLLDVAASVQSVYPDLPITLDPLELHGVEYHTGVGFAFFGAGLRGEIARGGSYITGFGEAATGLSVYMERVLRGLPDADRPAFIYIPKSIGGDKALKTAFQYATRGRHIVIGTKDGAGAEEEARASGCRFILRDLNSGPEEL